MFKKIGMALIGLLFFPNAQARAEAFYQRGPIACSTDAYVVLESNLSGHNVVHVTPPNGPTRTFSAYGKSHDIKVRDMPRKSRMSYGEKKSGSAVVSCVIDTRNVVGVDRCAPFKMSNGWGGRCDYCFVDKDGQKKCRHEEVRMIEITAAEGKQPPPKAFVKKTKKGP